MEKLINIICGMVVTMVLSFGTGATAEEIGPAPLEGVKVAIAEEIQGGGNICVVPAIYGGSLHRV